MHYTPWSLWHACMIWGQQKVGCSLDIGLESLSFWLLFGGGLLLTIQVLWLLWMLYSSSSISKGCKFSSRALVALPGAKWVMSSKLKVIQHRESDPMASSSQCLLPSSVCLFSVSPYSLQVMHFCSFVCTFILFCSFVCIFSRLLVLTAVVLVQ